MLAAQMWKIKQLAMRRAQEEDDEDDEEEEDDVEANVPRSRGEKQQCANTPSVSFSVTVQLL